MRRSIIANGGGRLGILLFRIIDLMWDQYLLSQVQSVST